MRSPFKRGLILGILILLSGCGPKDTRDPLLISADSGDAVAQYEWGKRRIGEAAIEDGFSWISKAAAQGHGEAAFLRANLLLEGRLGNERRQEGSRKMEELAKTGLESAEITFARLQYEGDLIEANKDAAFATYGRLIDKGVEDPEVLFGWARMVLEGHAIGDASEARKKLLQAANQNHGGAQYWQGELLEELGKENEAKDWYYKSSLNGYPPALFKMGIAYHKNSNNRTYAKTGFDYLMRAEKAGIYDSLYYLGRAYYQGIGGDRTPENREKGEELLYLASSFGSKDATALLLRIIYRKEETSLSDSVKAHALMRLNLGLKENLKSAVMNKVSLETGTPVFEKRVQLELRRFELAKKQYLASKSDGDALTEAEKAELEAPFSRSYGQFEDAYLKAEQEENGESLLTFGLLVGDEENEIFNKTEALWWLNRAADKLGIIGGMRIFELYKEGHLEWLDDTDLAGFLNTAVKAKDPQATYLLAKEYVEGGCVEQDYEQALKYLNAATRLGHPSSESEALQLLRDGKVKEAKNEQTLLLLKKLANEGTNDFRYLYADQVIGLYAEEMRVSFSPSVAAIALEIGEDSNLPFSRNNAKSIKRSSAKLKEFMERLGKAAKIEDLDHRTRNSVDTIFAMAEEGFPPAMRLAAAWYSLGIFCEKDVGKAVALIEKTTQTEGVTAGDKALLGYCYYVGSHVEIDIVKASLLMREAAEDGVKLARKYFSEYNPTGNRGKPTTMDLAYRAEALQDSEAMFWLARFFKKNTKFDAEYTKSEYMKWMGNSAKAGNIAALLQIGLAYVQGDGVEKNVLRGIRFAEQAAKKGNADAQYTVGFLYCTGDDIGQDLEKGKKYLEMAANQGMAKAKIMLERLSEARVLATGDVELEKDDGVYHALAISVLNQDFFPVIPRVIENGESYKVESVRGFRPIYYVEGEERAANRDSRYQFLGDKEFAEGKIVIEKVRLTAPYVRTSNGYIYTGLSPSLTFWFSPTTDYSNCYCLLILRDRDRKYNYYWRGMGNVKKDKRKQIKFSFKEMFNDAEDVVVYFFSGDREIRTDYRYQVRFFMDYTLTEFVQKRDERFANLESKEAAPKLFRGADPFDFRNLKYPEGAKVDLEISEFGYVDEVNLPEGIEIESRNDLLDLLGKLLFFPRIEDGQAKRSSVRMEIADCKRAI